MPIYEYRCGKCEHVFEELQKMGEGGENLLCPVCREPDPIRVLSCCNAGGSSDSGFAEAMPSPSSACGSGGFS